VLLPTVQLQLQMPAAEAPQMRHSLKLLVVDDSCASPSHVQYTMRVLQGGIIGSALIALGLALLGIFYWLLQCAFGSAMWTID